MIVAIPVTPDGLVDPRWGRAQRVAVASVEDGELRAWHEFDVRWGDQHDSGGEGEHHARIAAFLRAHGVKLVVADHMGPGMTRMLGAMGIAVRLGASGPVRDAALASLS